MLPKYTSKMIALLIPMQPAVTPPWAGEADQRLLMDFPPTPQESAARPEQNSSSSTGERVTIASVE